jgi:putative ABC transport system permease protein
MKWWQIRKRDADLERELQSDLVLEEEEQRDNGKSPEAARYAARRAFGNTTLIREQTHETWGWEPLEQLGQDLRYGFRQLFRNPGFTVVAVITLALGVALSTTIFSVVSETLLRKPPVRDPDTLCAISSRNMIKGNDLEPVSVPDFESWRKQDSVFESMAAETGGPVTLNSNGEPEVVVGGRVTPGYFDVIGIPPALGRGFLPNEAQAGNGHVVILSNALWRDRFASEPGAIGKDFEINCEPYTIVGVMPQLDSSFPRLWVPLGIQAKDLTPDSRGHYDLTRVLGRLKPGVTVTKAQAEMTSIAENLTRAYPVTNNGRGITVLTLQDYNIRSQGARNGVIVLMTVASFVLLIACANIAGMLLARGAARVHEMAIRAAVGAARLRLIRQMLAESLLIGAAGGGAGLLGSVFGIKLLQAAFAFNDFGKRVGEGLRLDVPTLFFTLTVSLLTTLMFGLMPAIRASKANPRDALTDRSPTSSAGFARIRMRSALVAGQIALAFVLLAGAGVMMRDTIREYTEPDGFNPDHVLAAQIALTGPDDQDPARQAAFFKQLIEKVREIPGVESADANTCLPLGCRWSMPFRVLGEPPLPDSQRPWVDYFAAGSEYFHTMQIPLMRGRGFMDSDNVNAPIVALVNVEFARRFFPGGDAIGHEIEIGQQERKQARIVGIVGNVNEFQGQLSPRPQIYEHYLQAPSAGMAVVLRSSMEPKVLAPMLQRAIWAVNRDQTASRIWTMQDLVDDNAGGDRLMVELLGVFACLALLLSAVGIYGVIAYSVTQRTREIGIRVALGAHKGNVLILVLRQGVMLSAIGCTIGLLLALPLPRVFSAVFNSFAPQGPMVAMAVGLIVPTVSMLATFIPARRAASLDPMQALRSE